MAWTMTYDLSDFRAAAGRFLRDRPAPHTVLLTALSSLEAVGTDRYGDKPPRYGWWRTPGGSVAGALVWTPPHPVLLSPMPDEALAELARDLRVDAMEPVVGVNAGRRTAETFATAWQRLTGSDPQVARRHRLYRLGTLTPPDPAPPGRGRPATVDDRRLLVAWWQEFAAETGASPLNADRAIDDKLSFDGIQLWEADGEPVSFAGVTRTIAGMARIAPVYTPIRHRTRGYAAAVTAQASRRMVEAGVTELLLFTDLANPTSNSVYQRLGYRVVEDHLVLTFTPAAT